MTNDNIRIRLISMPVTIHGFTVKSGADEYDIYLNDRLSAEMLTQTCAHELDHIASGDFDNIYTIDQLEAFMHAN